MNAKTAIQFVFEDNAEDAFKAHDAAKEFSKGDIVRCSYDSAWRLAGAIGVVKQVSHDRCGVGELVVSGQLQYGVYDVVLPNLEAATDADKRFWREVTRLKVGDKVSLDDGSCTRGTVVGVSGDAVKVRLSKTRRVAVYRENELRRQYRIRDITHIPSA